MFDFTRHWYNVTSLNIKQLMTLLPLRKLIAMKQLTIFWEKKQKKKNFFLPFTVRLPIIKILKLEQVLAFCQKDFQK